MTCPASSLTSNAMSSGVSLRLGPLALVLALSLAGAQNKSATRTLKYASRALQADNAAAFPSYFDQRAREDYPQLETHVVALMRFSTSPSPFRGRICNSQSTRSSRTSPSVPFSRICTDEATGKSALSS